MGCLLTAGRKNIKTLHMGLTQWRVSCFIVLFLWGLYDFGLIMPQITEKNLITEKFLDILHKTSLVFFTVLFFKLWEYFLQKSMLFIIIE